MLRESNYKKSGIIKSVMLVIISLIMLLLCFSGFGGSIARADYDNGIEISSDKVTGYYMTLNTKNFVGYTSTGWMRWPASKWGDFKAFDIASYNMTVLIFFKDVTYKDPESGVVSSLFISKPTSVTLPGSLMYTGNVTLPAELKINISKVYYDYLNYVGNYSRVGFSLMWRNAAHVVHNEGKCEFSGVNSNDCNTNCVFDISSTFSFDKVPTDPSDPDFDPGAGGGMQVDPIDISLLNKFFNFLTGIFKWSITYSQFCLYLKIFGIVLISLIVLPIVIKIIKRVYDAIVS